MTLHNFVHLAFGVVFCGSTFFVGEPGRLVDSWKGIMSRSTSPIVISDTELEDSYERSPRASTDLEVLESPVEIVKAPCYW